MKAVSARLRACLIDFPIEVHFKFYFANRQGEADLSNMLSGPEDLMQRLGVITNDRLIMRIVAEKFFGHDPRTEIEIFKHHPQGEK